MSPALADRFLTTTPRGKPPRAVFDKSLAKFNSFCVLRKVQKGHKKETEITALDVGEIMKIIFLYASKLILNGELLRREIS